MFGFGKQENKDNHMVNLPDYSVERAPMELKIKLMSDKAIVPVYSTDGACAADLFAATEQIKLEPTGPIVEYDTHVAFEIPPGYVGIVAPRSSVTTKTTLMLGNSFGIIDQDFRASVRFQYRNVNNTSGKKYKVGERIGQIMFVPVERVQFVVSDTLSKTARGEGGFGSTGV